MTSSPSIARRAVLAVALMIGFYLLAIGIAGALLAFPVFLVQWTKHLPAQIVLALLAAGTVTTLLSIAVFRASDRRAKDRGLLDQTTGS